MTSPAEELRTAEVLYLSTLQFAYGGMLDAVSFGDVCLVRGTRTGTPGPTLCGIDRFAEDASGWSVGGGVTGPGMTHTPCTGCIEVACRDYPGIPVAGMRPLSDLFAGPLGVTAHGHSADVFAAAISNTPKDSS